jgi:hypothetical protein
VHSCPEGYVCSSSNFCDKKGESPSGAAGTGGVTGTAGASGHAGSSAAGMGGATGIAGMGGATGIAGMGGGTAGGAGGAGGAKGTPCAGTCMIKIEGNLMNGMAPATFPPLENRYVGHWLFQSGSTSTVNCNDGSSKVNDLFAMSDYVDVAILSGTLTGSYFCDWSLTAGIAMTTIKPGQACSRNVTDAKTGITKFTWKGQTFTLQTADDKTGTLSATVNVDYVDDASKTGCTP